MHLKTLLILSLSVLALVLPSASSQPPIGPGTVGTTTQSLAVGNVEGYNQGEFFANGLFWVYYTDGKNEVFKTSTDGLTWSSPTVLRPNTSGSGFSGAFDGTYFYYGEGGSRIEYRRGVPNADGTITWSTPEQLVQQCGTEVYGCDDVAIAVDTAGYVWITHSTPYSDCSACLPSNPSYPYVTKDANNDGTWSTAAGFPVKLSKTGSGGTGMGDWGETLLPLSNQQVYVLFGHGPSYLNGTGSSPILGKLYNSVFGPQENATSSPLFANMRYSSAVTVGDNIYLAFLAPNSQTNMADVKFVERTASSDTWTPEVTIWPSLAFTNALALSKDSSGNLYLFWMGSPTANHIYYMKYTAATGTWSQNPTDWITETQTISDNRNIMVYPEAYQGNLGVTYETGSAAPYTIRFATLLSATPASTSYSTSEASTVTTSSTSAITTFAMSTQSMTLSAITNSPLVTETTATTSTVTHPTVTISEFLNVLGIIIFIAAALVYYVRRRGLRPAHRLP